MTKIIELRLIDRVPHGEYGRLPIRIAMCKARIGFRVCSRHEGLDGSDQWRRLSFKGAERRLNALVERAAGDGYVMSGQRTP